MDPQRPQQPTAEPTPDSPAPTQTSPVTPPEQQQQQAAQPIPAGPEPVPAGPQPVPGQPAQPVPPVTTPPLTPEPPKPGGNKKLLAAIVAVVIIIAGLIFLFLSPWSPFVSAAPQGPKLTVGSNKYVNPCSVLDKDVVTKELDIKGDVNKENVSETFAFDPGNTKDKELDVAKTSDSKSVTSSCTLKLDRVQEGTGENQKTSFINVGISLQQFIDEEKAKQEFDTSKKLAGDTKPLVSYKDTSYYTAPKEVFKGVPITVQPRILYKNMVITMTTPVGNDDASGEKNAGKLDTIAKDMISRIEKKEGDKPKNFNGVNNLNGHQFTDACLSVNYAKVVKAMGSGTQLDPKLVSGAQGFAPDDDGGQTPTQLISACNFSFRTQTEIDSANAYKPSSDTDKLDNTDKYPHYLSLQIGITEDKEKAQEFLKKAKEQADKNSKDKKTDEDRASVEDLKLGDGGLKVTRDRKYAASASSELGVSASQTHSELYYITKGANVYIISASYSVGDKPIKSEAKKLDNDQIKQIYKEMTMATKRAN